VDLLKRDEMKMICDKNKSGRQPRIIECLFIIKIWGDTVKKFGFFVSVGLIMLMVFLISCGIPNKINPQIQKIEPADNSTDVSVGITLKWDYPNPENLPIEFDLYFGEEGLNSTRKMEKIKSGLKVKYFKPELELKSSRTYVWKICVLYRGRLICEGPLHTFTTKENSVPVLSKISGTEGLTDENGLEFKWNCEDDGEIVKYELKKDNGDWIANDPATMTNCLWANYPEGQHKLYIRARDGEDEISNEISWTFTYEDSNSVEVPLKFVEVKGGTFMMGNTREDQEGNDDEKPAHKVELTYDYQVGIYEITNHQFLEFLNDAGVDEYGWLNGNCILQFEDIDYEDGKFCLKESKNGKENYPVINVTVWGAKEYCNWLSGKNGLLKSYDEQGNLVDYPKNEGYRLLTEAEWEYAARGGHVDIIDGKELNDYKYSGSDDIDEVTWYDGNPTNPENPLDEGKGTHIVGTKAGNEMRIRDMTGNVYEWCFDRPGTYTDEHETNPLGFVDPASAAEERSIRGGYYLTPASYCRITSRSNENPKSGTFYMGFRIVRGSD